ncbi:hypothetical protein ACOV11_28440, partial [Vibrio natriegens]
QLFKSVFNFLGSQRHGSISLQSVTHTGLSQSVKRGREIKTGQVYAGAERQKARAAKAKTVKSRINRLFTDSAIFTGSASSTLST